MEESHPTLIHRGSALLSAPSLIAEGLYHFSTFIPGCCFERTTPGREIAHIRLPSFGPVTQITTAEVDYWRSLAKCWIQNRFSRDDGKRSHVSPPRDVLLQMNMAHVPVCHVEKVSSIAERNASMLPQYLTRDSSSELSTGATSNSDIGLPTARLSQLCLACEPWRVVRRTYFEMLYRLVCTTVCLCIELIRLSNSPVAPVPERGVDGSRPGVCQTPRDPHLKG